MFAWARERAKALDAEFASTGELKGPLHGVPVCHSVVIRAKRTLIPVATDEYKGSMYAVFLYICTVLFISRHSQTVEIVGFDTSVGFTTWASNPAKNNSDVSSS